MIYQADVIIKGISEVKSFIPENKNEKVSYRYATGFDLTNKEIVNFTCGSETDLKVGEKYRIFFEVEKVKKRFVERIKE